MADPARAKPKCTEMELTQNFNEAINNLREAFSQANDNEKIQILLLIESLIEIPKSRYEIDDSDMAQFLKQKFKIIELRKLITELQKELKLCIIDYIKKEVVINWYESFWPLISQSETPNCMEFRVKFEEFCRNKRPH